MSKSNFRKIAIVLSSLAVLCGSFGIDTAYARDGGFPYERTGLEPPSRHQSLTPAWLNAYYLNQPAALVSVSQKVISRANRC